MDDNVPIGFAASIGIVVGSPRRGVAPCNPPGVSPSATRGILTDWRGSAPVRIACPQLMVFGAWSRACSCMLLGHRQNPAAAPPLHRMQQTLGHASLMTSRSTHARPLDSRRPLAI